MAVEGHLQGLQSTCYFNVISGESWDHLVGIWCIFSQSYSGDSYRINTTYDKSKVNYALLINKVEVMPPLTDIAGNNAVYIDVSTKACNSKQPPGQYTWTTEQMACCQRSCSGTVWNHHQQSGPDRNTTNMDECQTCLEDLIKNCILNWVVKG